MEYRRGRITQLYRPQFVWSCMTYAPAVSDQSLERSRPFIWDLLCIFARMSMMSEPIKQCHVGLFHALEFSDYWVWTEILLRAGIG